MKKMFIVLTAAALMSSGIYAMDVAPQVVVTPLSQERLVEIGDLVIKNAQLDQDSGLLTVRFPNDQVSIYRRDFSGRWFDGAAAVANDRLISLLEILYKLKSVKDRGNAQMSDADIAELAQEFIDQENRELENAELIEAFVRDEATVPMAVEVVGQPEVQPVAQQGVLDRIANHMDSHPYRTAAAIGLFVLFTPGVGASAAYSVGHAIVYLASSASIPAVILAGPEAARAIGRGASHLAVSSKNGVQKGYRGLMKRLEDARNAKKDKDTSK